MKRLILFSISCALVLGGTAASLAQGGPPQGSPPMPPQPQGQNAPNGVMPPPPSPGQQMPAPPSQGQAQQQHSQAQPPAPPSAPAPELPAAQLPPENEMPVFQNAEGYHYDPAGRRDPFKPYGESQVIQQEVPKGQAQEPAPTPTEPLQAFDVSQFKLLGIIWQVKDPKAMVADPSGRTHLIRKQTKIGRNSGFVAAIREGEVIVVEPSVGENGTQTAVTRILNLK